MLKCNVLKIQTLASGSRGNAVYIASEKTHILVDVGLNLHQLKKRLETAKINPNIIDAVLVTHEHADHVLGLGAFLTKYNAMLYLHAATRPVFDYINADKVLTFDGSFQIGDITVDFFPVPHDSRFCFGYTFTCGKHKISLATDLGRISDAIIERMNGSQIVMLECNHDIMKLQHNKRYPTVLKQRIMGSHGHLSNPSCALAVYRLAKMGVGQVILAHLSGENNSPALAYSFVRDFLGQRGVIEGRDIYIDVAHQDTPSVLFHLDEENAAND